MLVLTVDQVDSRGRGDRLAAVLPDLARRWDGALVLGPDRTAGDEFQAVLRDAGAALDVALELLRDTGWSVGMGLGPVDSPLPATTREATGPAFVAARAAVTEAKRSPHRFALVAEPASSATVDADGLSALLDLLLELRDRRTPEGWEVADRLADGATQSAVATDLGISPQAVSLRARTAGVRIEQRARPVLAGLLAGLDVAASA
ncbi:MAG: hypothetical protein QOC55_2455 [Thermoleophilaceae bacterium]|nr:hypothetical protein [Thermoleophilaceae bacterium]